MPVWRRIRLKKYILFVYFQYEQVSQYSCDKSFSVRAILWETGRYKFQIHFGFLLRLCLYYFTSVSPGIIAAWSFQGTIGENDNFNAESAAEALHSALSTYINENRFKKQN